MFPLLTLNTAITNKCSFFLLTTKTNVCKKKNTHIKRSFVPVIKVSCYKFFELRLKNTKIKYTYYYFKYTLLSIVFLL